jgi:hypothetical protein
MQHENMSFDTTDKLKAIAIISVFETGKSLGKFSTVAVLDDGAGISYGFSQFTHRSGSLAAVLEKYLTYGGILGRDVIKERMPLVRRITAPAIKSLSSDTSFRNALRAAGITGEMRQAQVDVALKNFLSPAERECEGLGFRTPLALAVVYDSLTHGSWERFRDAVKVNALGNEKEWLTEYVRRRDRWLACVPRLAKTRYRTKFFLEQIARQNWEMNLPLKPNGVAITTASIEVIEKYFGGRAVRQTESTAGQVPHKTPQSSPVNSEQNPQTPHQSAQPSSTNAEEEKQAETRPLGSVSDSTQATCLDQLESRVNTAAATYDQVERIATKVTSRNDAAKSLWTTVIGSITQTFWALFGSVAGIPREIWLVVAVIIALLMLTYLYRQIALGKIREGKSYAFRRDHAVEIDNYHA